jgi:cytochrome c
MKSTLTILVTLTLLSACGSKTETAEQAGPDAAPAAAETQTASAGGEPASFAQCAVCHTVAKDGENGVGPNLHAVLGKKAAAVAGFNYSPAMKDWGQTWTEASLDKYIENPRALVAGTRMSFAGQKDAAKRKEIIDWLKQNS